jgi:beta-fructofuranosidase
MLSQALQKARRYEEERGRPIAPEDRPLLHLTPLIGWMNDPNGFSFYNGKYHLFYQYHPYSKKWGPMHWGHAVSTDLLHWEHLPAALAPDIPADIDGCFSGSAIELDDGRQLLLYTGVTKRTDTEKDEYAQRQCLAVGDGLNYEKPDCNPVLTPADLPEGSNPYDFRDPKIWREKDGTYACVVTNRNGKTRLGRLLRFTSEDGFSWKFGSILLENNGDYGLMWECPDFFELEGRKCLLFSPMDMLQNDKYFVGNNTIILTGRVEDGHFIEETNQVVDCGLDFYATQTMETPDGRRVMTAWMQNWDTVVHSTEGEKWFGQTVLPRELSFKDGRLVQTPVRELQNCLENEISYEDVVCSGVTVLDGIKGRMIDMTVDVEKADCESFEIRFAENEKYHSSLIFDPRKSTLTYDRTYCGTRRAVTNVRKAPVDNNNGKIRLRIILDRFSAEVFINDGLQTMTHTLYTDQEADGISFHTDGEVRFSVKKADFIHN